MRRGLVAFFWLVAASCALAQGVPGIAIPSGLFAGVQLVGTFNPSDKDAAITLSNGNLTMTSAGGANTSVRSTNSQSAGQIYFEVTAGGSDTANDGGVGVGNASAVLSTYVGNANGVGYFSTNGVYAGNVAQSNPGTWAAGDVIGVKLDFSTGAVAFNKNGGSFTSFASTMPSGPVFIMCSASSGRTLTLNLTPTYPIPSGFQFWGY